MHRVWLTLLLAFALAASGMANAIAASACPMHSQTQVSAHACCDEHGVPMGKPGGDMSRDMSGCAMGMLCRTAPALAPTLEPVRLSQAMILISQEILREPAPASGPLQQLFRPPRSI
jgi:hypothetical protein